MTNGDGRGDLSFQQMKMNQESMKAETNLTTDKRGWTRMKLGFECIEAQPRRHTGRAGTPALPYRDGMTLFEIYE